MNVTPIRNPLYVTLSDGGIRNAYDIRLRNKLGETHDYAVTITSDADLTMRIEGVEGSVVTVPANDTLSTRIYIEAAPGSDAAQGARSEVRIWVADATPVGGKVARVHHDTVFNGAAK